MYKRGVLMIKLLVSDIDGTLLNEKHQISDIVRKAIHDLREAGISFIPASGRDYGMLMKVVEELGIKPKCICSNGAECYDNEGVLIEEYPLTAKKIKEVLAIIDELNLDIDFSTDDGRYNYGPRELHKNVLLARFQALFHDHTKQQILDFIEENKFLETTTCEEDIDVILKRKIMKIEVYSSNVAQRNLAFSKLKHIEGIVAVGSHDTNLEVTCEEATKGSMIETVCKHYGYKEDEVVVIGDGFNDVSMFQKFTHSFAMGQASDDLKKFATYEALRNDEDGVAHVIYSILNNGNEVPVK